MSDNKKWFKQWVSILTDPDYLNLSLADKGRWSLLGALICQQGTMGKLKIVGPGEMFKTLFEVASLADLAVALKRLPNVHLTEPLDAYGSFIVTMINWRKYQVDSTVSERVKRLRSKRRGEEKLTSKSTSTSPPRSAPLAAPVAPARSAPRSGNTNIAEPAEEWEVKNFDEAGENEFCAPPADWKLDKLRNQE